MASKHRKLLILIALLAAWALIFGFHTPWRSSVGPPAPGPAAPGRTPAAQDRDLPRLKTELLRLPPPTYTPEAQNIFGAPPPPPPPPPPRPAVAAAPPAAPPPPPPDPFQEEAKRLRYVGFLRHADNRATAFIIQGQQAYALDVGETLGGRFRVQQVMEDALLLTSPNGDKQVRLPLVATTAPPGAPR